MWKAVCRETKNVVAIKVIKENKLKTRRDLEMIKREVRVMNDLSHHQHVCSLHETVSCTHHLFIVVEYCSRNDLLAFIRAENGKQLPEDTVRKIMQQIVSGVAHIHQQGYIHRDLKPANVMLTGSQNNVKIIDFGMAKKASSISAGARHSTLGTPSFMAPEIYQNEVIGDAQKADVWSVGVIFYMLLSGGRPPFAYGKCSLDELKQRVINGGYREVENVSQEASELLKSMLTVDPQNRPTAQEILRHPYL